MKLRPVKVYFAGPEVFNTRRNDLWYCMNWARRHGFIGSHPADNPAPKKDCDYRRIFEKNIADITTADVCLFDLNPFRGHLPDDGTIFEMGLAYKAHMDTGVPRLFLGYALDRPDLPQMLGTKGSWHGIPVDPNGYFYDVGERRPYNLMLSEAVRRTGGTFFFGERNAVFREMADCIKVQRALWRKAEGK
jgi:hypothetical protein